jgi:hypothetical protein
MKVHSCGFVNYSVHYFKPLLSMILQEAAHSASVTSMYNFISTSQLVISTSIFSNGWLYHKLYKMYTDVLLQQYS